MGNTIKSKRISAYVEAFIDRGVRLLLRGKGQDFIEEYYDTISKIYNYQIPLKDIASKAKVKKTVDDYIADCDLQLLDGHFRTAVFCRHRPGSATHRVQCHCRRA